MSRALDLVTSEKRDVVLEVTAQLARGADPLALSEEFAKHLASNREQIAAAVSAEMDAGLLPDATREDKEQLKAEETARVDAECRRDLMEYLYLFQTWYRDVAVCHAPGGRPYVLHRDQLERIESAEPTDLGPKIAAIEKARVYLERFINEGRVFRDLFFALAR